jgi:hypothetical protein
MSAGICGTRPINDDVNRPRAAGSFWPIIRRLAPPICRKIAAVGSLIATGSPSQATGDFVGVGISSNLAIDLLVSRSAALFPEKTSAGG